MLKSASAVAAKDIRLTLLRGGALTQALLLGLLLLFLFSLSQDVGERMSPQGAATVFWLASAFCWVLAFNTIYSLEEVNEARRGLALLPCPIQAVWLGKAGAGLALLVPAQLVFLPATLIFLGQDISGPWPQALLGLLLVDAGMALLGSLFGALSQGQAARESLLSIILFPLLIPLLFAGIRLGGGAFAGAAPEGVERWLGIAAAFDALFFGAGLLLFPFIYPGED